MVADARGFWMLALSWESIFSLMKTKPGLSPLKVINTQTFKLEPDVFYL